MIELAKSLQKVISEKGWLAISSLYFDNSSICDVMASGGHVAFCEATNSVYWFTILDSTDTSLVEHNYSIMSHRKIGQQIVLVQQDLDCLQHVQYAMYAHKRFFQNVEGESLPYPTLPAEAELAALELDEETGLYSGTDGVVEMMTPFSHTTQKKYPKEKSAYLLYDAFYPTCDHLESSAPVEHWKKFYEEHAKFIKMVEAYLGVSGCI